MQNTKIRYSGHHIASTDTICKGAITLRHASPILLNDSIFAVKGTLADGTGNGIWFDSSYAALDNTVIDSADGYGIYNAGAWLSCGVPISLHYVTARHCGRNAIRVGSPICGSTVSFEDSLMPFVFSSLVTLADTTTMLVIRGGTIMFDDAIPFSDRVLIADGTICFAGDSANHVLVTSIHDTSRYKVIRGDTVHPKAGDWNGIYAGRHYVPSSLSYGKNIFALYTDFSYGGGGDTVPPRSMLHSCGTDFLLTHCTFSICTLTCYNDSGSFQIDSSAFVGTKSILINHHSGIDTSFIRNSDFIDIAGQSILNEDTSSDFLAKNNWWGNSSGPSGAGPGSGAMVSTHVDFSPWATTPHSQKYATPVIPPRSEIKKSPLFSTMLRKGTLSVIFGDAAEHSVAIEVFNASGRNISSFSNHSVKRCVAIPFDEIARGMYIMKLRIDGIEQQFCQRIIPME